MATCYQKHPFEIESEDKLTAINTKIFEIKKKIQLSEGQRKSHYEENEEEKQQNNELISTLKKEVRLRLQELAQARAVIGDEDLQIKKYLNEVSPVGDKTTDQIIHNLDLKVIEQRKMLDLLKYERKQKKSKLRCMEKEYEHLLIENSKSATEKIKSTNPAKKHASHLENEIHKVLVQWNEAELVKKKYSSIRKALVEDSVKFESSLYHITELLKKQREEINKLQRVRDEASEMRLRATAALMTASSRAQDAEQGRAAERAYFAQRFDDRKRELEKLEKRIFPPAASPQRGATAALMTASSRAQDAKQGRAAERAYFAQRFDDRKRELEKLEKRIFPPAARAAVVRQDSSGSTEGAATEESSAALHMEDVFQKLMKLTGVTEAEEVFDRFRAQRETCSRLGYLQQTTEEEKLALEKTQQALLAELEAFKFASVKDKDEAQDQINDLKAEIAKEEENIVELEKKNSEVDTLLMEIKKLLYDLCKLLDIVPDPPVPEWTAEARDIQEVVSVLSSRYAAAAARAADVRARRGDVTPVMPSNPPSGAASAAGVSTHTTPREAEAPVPTYKELLQREPVRPPPSDEEEDIPSRSYLKRQAQLILDTKSRRKGFRPPYPRK